MKNGFLIIGILLAGVVNAAGWHSYYPEPIPPGAGFHPTPYHLHSFYYYRPAPVQYPLFYYLSELRRNHNTVGKSGQIIEFKDVNDILNEKTEQAIRNNKLEKNNLAVEDIPIIDSNKRLDWHASELSDLTAASLIFLARQKRNLNNLLEQ